MRCISYFVYSEITVDQEIGTFDLEEQGGNKSDRKLVYISEPKFYMRRAERTSGLTNRDQHSTLCSIYNIHCILYNHEFYAGRTAQSSKLYSCIQIIKIPCAKI